MEKHLKGKYRYRHHKQRCKKKIGKEKRVIENRKSDRLQFLSTIVETKAAFSNYISFCVFLTFTYICFQLKRKTNLFSIPLYCCIYLNIKQRLVSGNSTATGIKRIFSWARYSVLQSLSDIPVVQNKTEVVNIDNRQPLRFMQLMDLLSCNESKLCLVGFPCLVKDYKKTTIM